MRSSWKSIDIRMACCHRWRDRNGEQVLSARASSKKDATATVASLLADLADGSLPAPANPGGIDALLAERGIEVVTTQGWRARRSQRSPRRPGATCRTSLPNGCRPQG